MREMTFFIVSQKIGFIFTFNIFTDNSKLRVKTIFLYKYCGTHSIFQKIHVNNKHYKNFYT